MKTKTPGCDRGEPFRGRLSHPDPKGLISFPNQDSPAVCRTHFSRTAKRSTIF